MAPFEYEYHFIEYEYESSNKRLPITFFPDFRGGWRQGRVPDVEGLAK